MANRQAVILKNAAKISNAQAAQCSSDFTLRKGIFINTGIFLQAEYWAAFTGKILYSSANKKC